MCFTGGEAPSCATEVERTARKRHRCCECNQIIHAGERYSYISGIWEGKASSFKTCRLCGLMREVIQHIEADEGCDWSESSPSLGNLFCDLDDSYLAEIAGRSPELALSGHLSRDAEYPDDYEDLDPSDEIGGEG
jgi:hypothetical protein